MSTFLHNSTAATDDTMAIAIPQVFPENSQAKNLQRRVGRFWFTLYRHPGKYTFESSE